MKICKKCKKKVANKAKICKFCGADVTKCRIIKQPSPVDSKKSLEVKKQNLDKEVVNVKNNDKNVKKSLNKTTGKKLDGTLEKQVVKDGSVKDLDKEKFSFVSKLKEMKKKRERKEKALLRRAKTVKEVKRLRNRKIIKYCLIVLGICLFVFLIVFGIRKIFHVSDVYIVKEGTYNNVFDMNQKIKYKDVIYSVTDAYVSYGTEYKSPKDGNYYVVVTIDFENDSNDKIRYSHKDWKMINSLGEESSRVFTPVNVSTALYSGNLVVGGKKTGSLVFEEPEDDENLLLNYYEYNDMPHGSLENFEVDEVEDDDSQVEEVKPVFQIRIKIPEDSLLDNN